MTSTEQADITLTHPSELLASIPALLGFHPADSLIAFGLRGPKATELTLVLRADLPPPSQARDLAHSLLPPLVQHGAAGIALAVVGGGSPEDDLPHRELLARCESLFVAAGMPVVHQLWVANTSAGQQWVCYDETDCTGVLADPDTTGLASIATSSGLTLYRRREDIVATLTPEPDDVLERRSQALDKMIKDCEPSHGSPDPPTELLDTVVAAIAAAKMTPPELTDDDVVRLALALSDHRIRDICLDVDELPDAVGAERLWTALARGTPVPERAEPACLLAFAAYARGDGVLAAIALDRAEEADPGHRLAGLLRGALSIGLPPSKLRIAGIRAAMHARLAMTEEPPMNPE